MAFVDIQFTIGGNLESISIHSRLFSEELSRVSIDDFKIQMIDILNISIRHFLNDDLDNEDQIIQRCILSRVRNSPTLTGYSFHTPGEMDLDIVFVLTECTRDALYLLKETIETASKYPQKFCLVYVNDESLLPSNCSDFSVNGLMSGSPSSGIKIGRQFWCINEDVKLETILTKFHQSLKDSSEKMTLTRFLLCWAYQVPPDRVVVNMPSIVEREEAKGKKYLSYLIEVNSGDMSWNFERRYTEFVKLHRSILLQQPNETGFIPKTSMPPLPDKRTSIGSRESRAAELRRSQLYAYLSQVLAHPQAMQNQHVLFFLGAMSNQQASREGQRVRNALSVSRLGGVARWGDIVLFRSENVMSGLQRLATGSEFDHVGVVVQQRGTDRQMLLEATSEGVTVFPLTARLSAYHEYGVSRCIVLRQYTGHRSFLQLSRMLDFVDSVAGIPYGFNVSKLIVGLTARKGKKSDGDEEEEQGLDTLDGEVDGDNEENSTSSSAPSSLSKPKSYFCSELVAAMLAACNILPSNITPSSFWPGSFSRGKDLDNICTLFGDEIFIDGRYLEINQILMSSSAKDIASVSDEERLTEVSIHSSVFDDMPESSSDRLRTMSIKPPALFRPTLL